MGQYIGARYVPRFMGVFDPTQAYENLDVVDNGLGTSYISKAMTPPGTSLTDTTYWALYGTSSGAIINLQNQINDMQDGTVPGSLQSQINDMQDGTVSGSLQDQINDNTSDIAALAKLIDKGSAKRVIVFSDSYGVVVNGVTPFTQILQTALASTPVSYEYYAVGSLGITPNTVRPEGLSAYLDANWYSSIATPETVTDIIVAMGANDIPNVAQLATYFVTLCANLKSKFINAKISFAFIGQSYNVSIADRAAAIKAYIDNAKVNGCYYMDGAHYIMADGTNLQNDDVHPTASGAQFIADMIIENLVNNSYHYYHYFSAPFKMDDEAAFTYQLNITINDDIMTATMNESHGYSAAQPYTFTSAFKTGTFTGNVPCRGNGSLAVIILVETAAGTHALLITITSGKAYVKAAYSNLTLNTSAGFIGNGVATMSVNN